MSTRLPRSGPVRDRTGGAGSGRWLAARAATLIGVTCVTQHVVTALAGQHEDGWSRALLLTMAAACVPCLRRLHRAPTRGGVYAVMLAVHLSIVAPWSRPSVPAHALAAPMAGSMSGPLTWTELGMWGGLALAALQVVLVAGVLAARLGHVPQRAAAEPVGAVPAAGASRTAGATVNGGSSRCTSGPIATA